MRHVQVLLLPNCLLTHAYVSCIHHDLRDFTQHLFFRQKLNSFYICFFIYLFKSFSLFFRMCIFPGFSYLVTFQCLAINIIFTNSFRNF